MQIAYDVLSVTGGWIKVTGAFNFDLVIWFKADRATGQWEIELTIPWAELHSDQEIERYANVLKVIAIRGGYALNDLRHGVWLQRVFEILSAALYYDLEPFASADKIAS